MTDIQSLAEYAPCFGTPKLLHEQNQQLEARFPQGTTFPPDATKALDRFWQVYDAAPEQIGSRLTRAEIGHLTWCFAVNRHGRHILNDIDATYALLALIQRRYRRSYLHGLRYSFFCGYAPKSPAFELLRFALRQMLATLDLRDRNHQGWRCFAETLPVQSHVAIARQITSDDMPYPQISQRFHLPTDASFYDYTCRALVDEMISQRVVRYKAKSLLDFLTQTGNLDAIKHTVEQLLFYYQDTSEKQKTPYPYINEALIHFALKHLGDIRTSKPLCWAGVSKRAQNIFIRWLSIIDLRIFFDKIALDRDRKAFWLEYLDSIDYSRLAVGKKTGEQLLARDRCAGLISGDAKQSALLLKIGDLVVVEFSGNQSCRYVYYHRSKPFSLNAQAYRISELCHPEALFKQDTKKGWQSDFAATLHNHFGIYRHQARRHTITRRQQRQTWQSHPPGVNMQHRTATV